MVSTRYEIRIDGAVSERVRSAFRTLDVTAVPRQTIVSGELALAEVADLPGLLALCRAMGLEVVSVRRLPGPA
ncbi:hypothetical protein [Pseudonocardia sp. N23]|uniref:hypothetical protein n=1 Tax=Pseudonocardia sp. N23 TaxID=1987376 RepID=UPI000BFDDE08|nr:hypothetical protein [Pseudonocardia sp. N23]GAY10029.1 hypothetical protein TOK_4385 [Pseudonocardia sp. N23]